MVQDPPLQRLNEIRISMNGTVVKSSAQTLKKIVGSKLAALCSRAELNPHKIMTVDRDAEPFKHVLQYLESDQKLLPNNLSISK